MTLHEAIEKLLFQAKRPMTTQQIADGLNRNGWYRKKDGSAIQAFQIHGRTKNYPNIFSRNGSLVTLVALSNWLGSKVDANLRKKAQVKASTLTAAHAKSSFSPISNSEIEILILGTMPGDKSIELGEYYGHPRNRFWQIIATVTNNPLRKDYNEKKALLLESRIGIWDIAHKAIRKGSLDTAITDEEPNDLDTFISTHRKLKAIAFNGAKAKALFDKHFRKLSQIKYFILPSTSPANTGISFQDICKEWMQILKY